MSDRSTENEKKLAAIAAIHAEWGQQDPQDVDQYARWRQIGVVLDGKSNYANAIRDASGVLR